ITLCPPGACPPDRTTPILRLASGSEPPAFKEADGCPNSLGKSLAISSALLQYKH
ncbi:hypothetical protein Tco_0406390, partial [Tanacetum coccineum]